MRRLFTILCFAWLFAVLPEIARCAIYNVTVGGPGVLRYNPEFVVSVHAFDVVLQHQ